ncbi:MAG: hypothetical protein EVB11_01545 [Winogradskyella sp.]|nr:MAG: hypothetical protein EVB11_01545 [Winogradskyella sp.]
MKVILKLSLILLLFSCFYSCETEEIQEDNIETKLLSNKSPIREELEVPQGLEEPIDLENRMQWISFMTVQVLLRNNDARDQFRDEVLISGTSNAFHIKALLNPDVRNETFKDEFRVVFYLYYNENDVCDGIGRPRGGPKPPGNIGGDPYDPNAPPSPSPFDLYLSSILYDDCLEFYLPNGFNPLIGIGGTGGMAFAKSTAHPLTNATTNIGYHHVNSCLVSEITIDNSTLGPIIVVRPLALVAATLSCSYNNYPVDDFEDFLE